MAEFTNNEICEKFGILEWPEKKIILGEEVAFNVVEDLKEGINNPLVELCRLPFPEFAKIYLSRYEKSKSDFEKDPFLGFKLFLLSPEFLKKYVDYSKGIICPKSSEKNYQTVINTINSIRNFLNRSIQDIITPCSSTKREKPIATEERFNYILRYIDLETAKRMNLKSAFALENDGAVDYSFQEKLNCLNPAVKYLLVLSLGWFGHKKMLAPELRKIFYLDNTTLHRIIVFITSLLDKPLGEFKYAIGYVDREYKPGETKEYTNKVFRDLDISISVSFIKNHYLSQREKEILSTLSKPKQRIYIARKYLFESDKQTAENLAIAERDIKLLFREKVK